LAAFFAAGGVGLLLNTPACKTRIVVLILTPVLAALTISIVVFGAWEQAWFWNIDFHRRVSYDRQVLMRLNEFFALAPAIWIGLATALFTSFGKLRPTHRIATIALLVGLAANLSRRTTYGEYVTPFVPAAAMLVAPWLVAQMKKINLFTRTAVVALAAGLPLLYLPKLSLTGLANAATASSIMREHLPHGGLVVASMPELAVASGHPTYPQLAMGKFSVTEDFSDTDAERRHMVTPRKLIELLVDPRTCGVALSRYDVWNFAWSLPSMHGLSPESKNKIVETLATNFDMIYNSEEYAVFMRKTPAPDTGSGDANGSTDGPALP
jgi:hypothetical protein